MVFRFKCYNLPFFGRWDRVFSCNLTIYCLNMYKLTDLFRILGI